MRLWNEVTSAPSHLVASQNLTCSLATGEVFRFRIGLVSDRLERKSSIIKRAAHAKAGPVHDVQVDLRCGYVLVAQQVLHNAHIIARFE